MRDNKLSSIFLFKLEIAAKQFRKYKNRVFREHQIDITSDQWILLKNINEAAGINQSELAIRCKKEAAAVTRTLDILEKKQWISREKDPNSRRVYKLFVTDDGQKMIAKILPIALATRAQASNGLSDEELDMLNHILDKIFTNLK